MSRAGHRTRESGVVLVNVLVVLAIAGGLMALLASSQRASISQAARSADAAVAERIALGAEASVVAALRRDMAEAPEVDHLREPWAASVIQERVDLPTGTFSVAVADLQGKYDVNQLADRTAGSQVFAARLMRALDLPAETAPAIGRILRATGPVGSLDDLAALGLPDRVLDRLAPHVTALPVPGTINLNSADPVLLSVMTQNEAQARRIVRLREREGGVTVAALREAGLLRPQNSGVTSDVWRVDVTAEAGSARLRLRAVLLRRDEDGVRSVSVLERRFLHDGPETAGGADGP